MDFKIAKTSCVTEYSCVMKLVGSFIKVMIIKSN